MFFRKTCANKCFPKSFFIFFFTLSSCWGRFDEPKTDIVIKKPQKRQRTGIPLTTKLQRTSESFTGIENTYGTCYLNAGLQALFSMGELNQKAKNLKQKFADNLFFQHYLVGLNRYENAALNFRAMNIDDLSALKIQEHEVFSTMQTFLSYLNEDQTTKDLFAFRILSIQGLTAYTVQDLLIGELESFDEPAPEFLIVLFHNEQGQLWTPAQQNKIPITGLEPFFGERSYNLIAAVETCYEGENDQTYTSPNHVVAYRKVQDMWFFVNDSQYEERTERQVVDNLQSGNGQEYLSERFSLFMVPAALVYRGN